MKNLYIYLALAILSFSSIASAQISDEVNKPYALVVWADLSFDENAQLTQITILEKNSLPKPFVSFLMTSIASGPASKHENAEIGKQLETGLKIIVQVDSATSKATLLYQEMMPRPTRAEQHAEPVIRLKGEWSGRIFVSCAISEKGRCSKPKIAQSTNAPGEIPKVLLATLGSWRFIPQKRAGKAIEGEFSTWVSIEADTTMPPEEFGKEI